jgi:DNA-directed RNA polymerase specialized sigma subunit
MNTALRNEKFGDEHDMFDIEKNMKLIHKAAYKMHRTLESFGIVDMMYEDVLQAALMVFTRCTEMFNKESGYRFSTYFISAMNIELAKVAKKHTMSPKLVSVEALSDSDDGELSIYDISPSESATPDELYERRQHATKILDQLSVRTRFVVACLVDPSPMLIRELSAKKAYAAKCIEQGIRTQTPSEVDVNLIANYYGFSRTVTTQIKDELRKVTGDPTLWRYKRE